jgi:gliding motility-associated-like protein
MTSNFHGLVSCSGGGGGSGDGFALTATGYPVVSSFTIGTNSHIPANASDPDLPSGFAYGGYSGNGGNGQSGYVVLIKMNTNPPPVANITYNQPLCEKDTLKLQGSGGSTYLWTGPNSFTSAVSNPIIPNVSNANSGYYTLLVQSVDGCVDTAMRNIIFKPLPPKPTSNSPLCEGGNLSLVGSGAISYTWINTNNGFVSNSSTVSITNVTSNNAGNYYYFATGSNGCIRKDTINVIVNPNPNSVISSTNVSCNGFADGSALATPTIGTSPYFYLWDNGATSALINNLPPGTYTVRVTDANNCIAFATTTITEPPPISTTVNTKDLDCYNIPTGSATVIANGGTGPYTFTWMPVGQTGPSANNLSAGNYIVQIKDANNCSYSQTFTINQPPQLQGSIQFTPVTCWGGTDGAVNVMASGGTAPYSYLWLPININNSFASNLPAGIYTLNLTDVKNCIFTQTVQVTEPPPVMLSVSPSQTICFGQSTNIYAFANGGIPPYTYTWSVPGLISTGPHSVSPTSTTIYSVIAQDANGCASLPQTIAINVLPPLSGNNTTITACDKDTVVLSFTLSSPGNGGPYSYNWQNGTYTPTLLIVADFNTNPNVFNVVVSDGCTVPDATVAITLSVHPLPKGYFITDKKSGCEPLSITYTPISNGTNDQYLWHFEDGTSSTSVTPTITYTTGIYSATLHITDQYGCQIDTVSVKDVTVFPKPIADFVPTPSVVSNVEPIVTFNNLSIGGTFYQWNFNDPYSNANLSNEVNPIHYYEKPGEYEVALFVMNEFDCRDSVYKTIKVGYDFTVFIPNVFTPDGDGLNDIFNVKGIGISDKDFLLRIFNRWGHLIYETEDITKGWDGFFNGKICEDGQYIYYIQLKPEKSDRKNDIRIFKGNVFLFNKQKAPEY